MNHPKEPAPRVGRYEIKRGLGRGASSRVYLAYDPTEGRDVAIKVLDREFAADLKNQERFEREAKAMAALSHPNIVKFFDHGGSHDNHLFLVMEVIRGSHIGTLHRKIGSFPETILAAIGLELASALSHAHSFGIIHRDLKPENVLIDKKSQIRMIDFSLSKTKWQRKLQLKKIVEGTPLYMAPEQIRGEKCDPRTDIYAFGVLMYELLTKRPPFLGTTAQHILQKHLRETPPPMRNYVKTLSHDLDSFMQKLLAKNPDDRFPNMISIIHELSKWERKDTVIRIRQVEPPKKKSK